MLMSCPPISSANDEKHVTLTDDHHQPERLSPENISPQEPIYGVPVKFADHLFSTVSLQSFEIELPSEVMPSSWYKIKSVS